MKSLLLFIVLLCTLSVCTGNQRKSVRKSSWGLLGKYQSLINDIYQIREAITDLIKGIFFKFQACFERVDLYLQNVFIIVILTEEIRISTLPLFRRTYQGRGRGGWRKWNPGFKGNKGGNGSHRPDRLNRRNGR